MSPVPAGYSSQHSLRRDYAVCFLFVGFFTSFRFVPSSFLEAESGPRVITSLRHGTLSRRFCCQLGGRAAFMIQRLWYLLTWSSRCISRWKVRKQFFGDLHYSKSAWYPSLRTWCLSLGFSLNKQIEGVCNLTLGCVSIFVFRDCIRYEIRMKIYIRFTYWL